jgi:hypothetical protein
MQKSPVQKQEYLPIGRKTSSPKAKNIPVQKQELFLSNAKKHFCQTGNNFAKAGNNSVKARNNSGKADPFARVLQRR